MTDMSFRQFLVMWNQQQRQSTPDIHLELVSWLEQRWKNGDKKVLIMAFRGFGKSTILGVFCTWILWRNPDLRILILAADLALARKMVRQVKRIIEKHSVTTGLKPDRADQWGAECFTIKRKAELRDPSMLAKGIDTNLTGTRADVIICDDVEVPRTSNTAYKRAELRERLNELDYILTPDGSLVYIGTPHHYNTIYAEEKRKGEESVFLKGYARHVIPVIDKGGNSVWPERFSPEKIESILTKTGPSNFASQMLCHPVNSADGKFNPEHLTIYHDEIEYSESAQKPVLTIGGVKMITGAAWWDPAFGNEKGDRSVVAIVFKGENEQHYIHRIKQIFIKKDSVESEMNQQCEQVARMLEECFVPNITIEVNGIGAFLPGHLRRYLQERKIPCFVHEVHSKKAKNLRISEAFEAALSAKNINAHRKAAANSLIRQLEDWNAEKKNQEDDVLDAVAGAMSLQEVKFGLNNFIGRQNWQKSGEMSVAKTILD